MTSQSRIAIVIAVHCLLLSFVIWHHPLWGDETHSWQIAVASKNLIDLVHNARYEMHPLLWYAILFVASRFSTDPNAVKVVHVLIAEGLAFLILRCAPFRWPIRAGLLFTAVFFFEYGVMSRNYSIGALCLLGACAMRKESARELLFACIVLGLAAQCNAFALLIAFVYGMMLVARHALRLRRAKPSRRQVAATAASAAMVLGASALSALQLKPPGDINYPVNPVSLSGPYVLWFLESIGRATTSQWTGWQIGDRAQLAVSAATIASIPLLLRRRRFALAFYFLAMAPALAFDFIAGLSYGRHIYHFFLIYLMALWMGVDPDRDAIGSARELSVNAAMAVILAAQIVGCAGETARDWTHPISRARDVAAFIEARRMADLPIAGYKDIQASNVTAFLNRPIYSFQSQSWRPFIVWKRPWVYDLDAATLSSRIQAFAAAHPDGCLILLSPDNPKVVTNSAFTVLGHFGYPTLTDYTYTLIFMKRQRSSEMTGGVSSGSFRGMTTGQHPQLR